MLKTHLSVLETSASRFASASVFRIPELDPSTKCIKSWNSITYYEFYRDVETFAKYWTQKLEGNGISQRSVIGVWPNGLLYTDVLHIYGLSRAGYIPQLLSIRLPSPVVIYELLHRAGARALIYDACFSNIIGGCPVPAYLTSDVRGLDLQTVQLSPISGVNPKDTVFIFHTSGSTSSSGSPKLVPCSYLWLSTVLEKTYAISLPRDPNRQDVTVAVGSMCHIAQSIMFTGTLQHGSCVIQPISLDFSSGELMDMVARCGLNRINQLSSFLGKHLRASREDPRLLSVLVSLDDIVYGGLSLPREEEQWAYHHGIKIRNIFSSTEVGPMLLSGGCESNPALMAPLPGTSYDFLSTSPALSSTDELFELVILSDSPDCPDVSLRHADGHFHTGDLFEQILPGYYLFRGRDDDWIKTAEGHHCDTRAIEDNARTMCGALISECIVVGTGRPSPVMFIEPGVEMNCEDLKKGVFHRIRDFHSRRHLDEQIISPDTIVVVPKSTLPRTATKGNIRRRAVEEAFRSQIDEIFAQTN